MSFQICIRTAKPLQQLATEIRDLFSLPPFKLDTLVNETYCQFETLGLFLLLRLADEDERDPEVIDYPYCFDLQTSFTEHNLNTDDMEYNLQPYYAQLLTFHLDVETACQEKKMTGQHWQIRYSYYKKNPQWDDSILYGEDGWAPAVSNNEYSAWRIVYPTGERY